MKITSNRRKAFCLDLLSASNSNIGFADIGSGGPLKEPWRFLPEERLTKFTFEPADPVKDNLPVCISNHSGITKFNIAHDERASSFHEPDMNFVNRYNQQSLLRKKAIDVSCITLDEHFNHRYGEVDAIDINVEGHDYQVLQGGHLLFLEGFIKLVKVEFELTSVWHGQGWFSDIDIFLRNHDYELVNIEIAFARPAKVVELHTKGEPLWGKAYYVPSSHLWATRFPSSNNEVMQQMYKAITLFVAADLPGRAFDILDLMAADITEKEINRLKSSISYIYDWAKLEDGLARLYSLFSAVMRMLTRKLTGK